MPGLQISCTIPMCLAMRRSHQLVKICDVFLHFLRCTLCMHIEHPSISRPQTQLWMWGYTRWFWSPCWTVLQTDPWEPSFCKSTHEKHPPAWKKNLMPFWPLSSSNQIWLHKDMRGNDGLHSPCQQLGSWFHVPISNFSPSKNRCLIIYIISHLLSNCPALACANNVFALLQQGCDLRWSGKQPVLRLGFAQALAVKCGPVFHVAALAWHRILERIQPTRRNMKKLRTQTDTDCQIHKKNVGEERKNQLLWCETNPWDQWVRSHEICKRLYHEQRRQKPRE